MCHRILCLTEKSKIKEIKQINRQKLTDNAMHRCLLNIHPHVICRKIVCFLFHFPIWKSHFLQSICLFVSFVYCNDWNWMKWKPKEPKMLELYCVPFLDLVETKNAKYFHDKNRLVTWIANEMLYCRWRRSCQVISFIMLLGKIERAKRNKTKKKNEKRKC